MADAIRGAVLLAVEAQHQATLKQVAQVLGRAVARAGQEAGAALDTREQIIWAIVSKHLADGVAVVLALPRPLPPTTCDHTIHTVNEYPGNPGGMAAGPRDQRCACGRYSLADLQQEAMNQARLERAPGGATGTTNPEGV